MMKMLTIDKKMNVNPFEKGSDAWLMWNNHQYNRIKKLANKELDEYNHKISTESLDLN